MKSIFIHVPKTGGTFIKRVLLRNINLESHTLASSLFTIYDRDKYFSFSFVRNPWDRFVSAYRYLTEERGHEIDNAFGRYIKSIGTFKEFVLRCDAGFKPEFTFKNLQKETFIEAIHFLPQNYWIDRDIDFTGRFEFMNRDLDYVCDRLNIPKIEASQINSASLCNYRDYYDDETKKIIGKIYEKDVDLYKYSF